MCTETLHFEVVNEIGVCVFSQHAQIIIMYRYTQSGLGVQVGLL